MVDNVLIGMLISIIVVLISLIAIINAVEVSLRREMKRRYTSVLDDVFKDGYERGKAVRKI
jgi:hypothetical protein